MEQWCEVSADEAPDDWFEANGLEEQPSDLAFIDNVLYEISADEGLGL